MKIPLSENEFSLLIGLSLCHDPIHDFKMQTKVINDKETMTKILGIDYLLNEREEEYYEVQQGGKLIPSQKPSLLKSEVKFIKKHKNRDKLDEKINESAYPLLFYLGLLTNDDINSIKTTVKDTNDLQYVKDKIISKIIEKAKIVNQEKAKGNKKKKTFKKKNLKKQKTKKKPKKKLTKRKQKKIKKTKTKKNLKGGGKSDNEKELDKLKKRFNQLDAVFNGTILDEDRTEGYFNSDKFINSTRDVFTKYRIDASKQEDVRKFLDEMSTNEEFIKEIYREELKIKDKMVIGTKANKTIISYKVYCNEFLPLKKKVEELQAEVDAEKQKEKEEKAEAKKAAAAEKASQKEKKNSKAGPSGEAPAEAPVAAEAHAPPPPPPAPAEAPEDASKIDISDDDKENWIEGWIEYMAPEEKDEEKERSQALENWNKIIKEELIEFITESIKDKEIIGEAEEQDKPIREFALFRLGENAAEDFEKKQLEQKDKTAKQKEQAEKTLKMRDVERIKYTSKEASKFAYKHIGLQSHDQKSIKNYTVQQIKDLIQKISTKDEIIEVVSKDKELSELKNDAKKPLTVIEILEKSTSTISSIFTMLEKNRGNYLRKLAELLVKKKLEEDYRELQLPFIVEEKDEKELIKRIKENEELVSFKAPGRLLSIGNNKIMQLFDTIFDIIDISTRKETPLYELLQHEKNIFRSLFGKSFKFKMELTGNTKSWTGKDEVAQPNADEALKLYFVLTYLNQIGVDLTDLDTKTLRSKSGFSPEEILRKYNGKRVIINNGALPFASTTPYNGELMKHAIGSITSSIDSAAGGATGGMKYNFEPYERGNLIVEFNCNDKYFRISLLDKGIKDEVYNCELFIEFKFENKGITLEVSEEKGNVKKTQINKKGILDLNKSYQNMLDDITHYIAKQIVFKRDVPFQWENLFDDAEFLETFIQSYNLKGLGDLLIELTSSLNNGGYEGEINYGGEDEARIEKFDEKGNAPRLYIAHDWPSAIRYMLFKTTLEDKYKNILSEGGYFESRIDKQNNAYLASLLI